MSQLHQRCGDLPFLIRKDGSWLYRGSPIRRKEMVCLFSSLLSRDEAGDYWLETPSERGRIAVEDAPWIAVELTWCGQGRAQRLSFRTNVDQMVALDASHPIRIESPLCACGHGPKPYLQVRAGAGGKPLEARLSRPVHYELAALAEPRCMAGQRVMGVWSDGVFFPLEPLSEMPR